MVSTTLPHNCVAFTFPLRRYKGAVLHNTKRMQHGEFFSSKFNLEQLRYPDQCVFPSEVVENCSS